MNAWYNEFDTKTASWLQFLAACGEVTPGRVDVRSIADLGACDIPADCVRHHFFAGIGGWDYALRLAGWPDDAPVWTASLPCQPFSAAGKQRGTDDERHLWPVFRNLVEQYRPPIIFGEQVASKSGRAWLASVQADLEALGYSTAAADLCAASVGAPHIRQRLYWCAVRQRGQLSGGDRSGAVGVSEGRGSLIGLGLPHSAGREPGRTAAAPAGHRGSPEPAGGNGESGPSGDALGAWADVAYLPCADEKSRPIKPGIEPLVDGLPGRVGLLRGYGNAIVPQVAAIFVKSVIEVLEN